MKNVFNKAFILDTLRMVIFALLFSMVAVLIFALIVKYANIGDNAAVYINQAIKVLALVASALVGLRGPERGWLKGLIGGMLFIVLSFAIFSIISGELNFSDITVFDFIIGAGAGAVSGVIAVNTRSIKKSA